MPTTSYAKMIDIWMIFCMLNPFCEVLIHALRHTLKNTAWTNQVSMQGKELDVHLKRRMVLLVVGGSLLVLALLFLVVYWAVALHHYFAVSSTSMATSAEQSCIYQFV